MYVLPIRKRTFKGRDNNGDTALTLAGALGSKETVKLLINEFNADVHELGAYGRNCFLIAAFTKEAGLFCCLGKAC